MKFQSLAGCLVLAFASIACGDKDTVCEASEKNCDGEVLQECVDGDWSETDCEAEGMICHDMGDESHCMPEGSM